MSTLLEKVIYHSRTRHQSRLWVGLVLILLSAFWLYSISDSTKQRLFNNKKLTSTKDRSSWDHNSTQSEWMEARPGHLIPPKIWQIMLPKGSNNVQDAINPDTLKQTATWLAKNQDYVYTLVGENGGRDFISRHFNHTILSAYDSLPNVGMKSDLLRYLLLDIEGGVYTDTDTVALKPIDEWVPEQFRGQTRLIVGIEFDQRDGGLWADIPHPLQFCQWTIAAAPGHPVFRKMVARVIQSWDDLVKVHGITWKPTSFEVMNSTGPAAWTDVVWEYLQETDSTLTNLRNLSSLGPPRLFGDALVLPIDGFGTGQSHSGSTHDGSTPDEALIKHLFGGSWRGD
ncbi:initiation-specific alpha-1,6-mannosyltransferase [Colletotrichum somersetense]|nr:initiation-specific alpha-1,6-mannosyltransferase [Colletotrichum somersetense]